MRLLFVLALLCSCREKPIEISGDDTQADTQDSAPVPDVDGDGFNAADDCDDSNGAIHLDIGRLYQPDIVTMRVFDVLACGGFLLAGHSEALLEMFTPGVELECWSTLDELEDKVRFYQQHPDKAQTIALAGRARVLRDHTIRQRLLTMLSDLAAPEVREAI